MSKYRHASLVCQLGFVALLFACRVVSSLGEGAVWAHEQAGQTAELQPAAAR